LGRALPLTPPAAPAIAARPVATSALLAAALAAAVALVTATPAAAIDPHTLAPQDTEFVLVIPNPKATSDRIAELSQRFNIPAPGAANVVGQIMSSMGNPEAVAADRPLVVAVEDISHAIHQHGGTQPDSQQLADEPTTLTFVPVADYGRFAASLGATDTTAISRVVLADGTEAYVKQVDDYAAMANHEHVLADYQPSDATTQLLQAVGPYADRLADNAHAMALIDGDAATQAIRASMAQQQAAEEPSAVEAASAEFMLDALEGADAILVTADLGESAIRVAMATTFSEGSLGAATLHGKPAGSLVDQLRDLPEKPFIYTIAMDLAGIDAGYFVERMMGAMPPEYVEQVGDVDAISAFMSQVNAGASTLYAPDVPMMGMNGLTGVYDVDDADAFVDAFAELLVTDDVMSQDVPAPEPDGQMATAQIVNGAAITRDALTVEGVSFAEWTYSQEMPAELLQQLGPMAALAQTNTTGYVGGTDGRVIMTSSPDVAVVRSVLADKDRSLADDPALAAAFAGSPTPDAILSGHLSLQGVAQVANSVLPFLGIPPFEVPADLPPLSFDMGANTGQLVAEVTLPMETLTFIAIEAQKLQANAQPGNDNPPAPRDGTPPAPRF
ncbi:MAG: hypothetical protein AAF078_10855, partial [Planctomycetota bacterium]